MKIDKLNIQQVCSIKSIVRRICFYYDYKKSKRFLWWKSKEGFYFIFTIGNKPLCSKEEIESSGEFYVDGENIFYKPYIEIRMSNEDVHNKYFETEKDLFDFMECEIMKSVNWINK